MIVVVIPHLGGLNGSRQRHLGPFFLCLAVPVVLIGMGSLCGVFPVCIGNLSAGNPQSFLVSHFSLE